MSYSRHTCPLSFGSVPVPLDTLACERCGTAGAAAAAGPGAIPGAADEDGGRQPGATPSAGASGEAAGTPIGPGVTGPGACASAMQASTMLATSPKRTHFDEANIRRPPQRTREIRRERNGAVAP